MTRKQARILFAALMLGAALLRLTGVSWDDRRHLHPDERFLSMLEEAIHFPKTVAGYFDSARSPLNPFNQKFNPVYGTFPVFLAKGVCLFLFHQDGYDSTFLVGRVLSGLFDLLTVWATYLLARRFGRRGSALVAAALIAFCPLGIQLSHFWGVDGFLTTFSAFALLGSVRIARGRTSAGSLAATGAAIGFAAACKITGLALLGPAGFAVLASAIFRAGPLGRLRAFLAALMRGFFLVLAAFVALRVAFPYGFAGLFRLEPRWIAALRELTNLTKGYGFPPQVQWAGRTPLFPLRNFVLWGAGIFFGLPAIVAFVWSPIEAWRRRNDGIFLLWLHAAIVFGYHATASTKNIRYFYPAYPALAVLSSVLLRRISGRDRVPARGFPPLRRFLPAVAAAGTVLFGLAFSSIYRHPNTRGAASRWMYENIRPPSAVANEDWDDGLPFPDPGYEVKDYAGPVLHMYNPDSPQKVSELVEALQAADWIAITSNRAYASVTRVPDAFPMTREYYRSLFDGGLGFAKAADFVSYPSLGPIVFPDDSAEETFTVYDHPRVLLFRKTKEFDASRIRKTLLAALPSPAPPVMDEWAKWPKARRRIAEPILPGPAGSRTVASARAKPLSDELIGSWPAAIVFYLAVLAVGALAFPLCFRFFTKLDDRGFGFARIAGLAAATYLLTFAVQFHWLGSGRGAAAACVLAVGAAGALVGWRRRHEIGAFLRGRRRALLLSETVFLFGFLLFAGLRAFNPEILWGEKPMDFSILNILVRTRALPASDPWFSGAPLGYYTFGQEMIALLSLLTGLSTRYTFNLAFGLIGGATLQGIYALVRDWTLRRRAGLLAAAFTGLLGNLAGLREWLINQPKNARHLDWHYFWATSRVTGGTTINEYPFWSLVFADLHSHVLAFPFFALFLAGALELLRRHADPNRGGRSRIAAAVVLGAISAAHALTNAWDVPFLAGMLAVVAVAVSLDPNGFSLRRAGRGFACLIVSGATAATLVLPLWVRGGGSPGFGRSGEPGAAGIDVLTVFGFFMFAAIAWWLVTAARRRIATGGGRSSSAAATLLAALALAAAAVRIPDLFFAIAIVLFLAAALAFETAPENRLACGLVASAFFLVLFAQRFYIYDRQNTFFKLYIETWFLFAVAVAVLLFGRRDREGGFGHWPRPLRAIFLVLAALALFTSVTGGRGGIGANRPSLPDNVKAGPPTLDGLAYLGRWHPGEDRAVSWLRHSVAGTPVVLEAQGPSYQQFGRISMLTGLPTVLGWEYHVQQRGNAPAEIDARREAVRAIYTTPIADGIEALLRRYHVGYVYIGALERQNYPAAGLAKFDSARNLFEIVYENPEVRIYRVRGGDTGDVVVPRREALPAPEASAGSDARAPDTEPEEAPSIASQAAQDVPSWGKMREPRDASVDRKGRVWIADFGHSTLRLFDPAGGFLGGWGGRGDGQHGFRELCGVAARGDDVYVADTWNGRVEKFGQEGTWKAAAKELYGPRGVAVTEDGAVWVSDTGNNRLMIYDQDLGQGRPVGKKGSGADELDNPVGIAVGPSGKVYVADTANRRIQVLDRTGQFLTRWPIVGWGSGVEPHIEVDADENVWVTDPAGNALLEFGPDGRLRQRLVADSAGQPFSKPTGLAIDRASATLYVVDSGNNAVSLVRLPKPAAKAGR